MKYLIVDPPSGWMYGFPRPLATVNNDASFEITHNPLFKSTLDAAMLKSGYSEKEVQELSSWCRLWFEEKPTKDDYHLYQGLPHIE